MRFNKLAKELDLSVGELADKVSSLIPNANAGTDVSDSQKEQIIALLTQANDTEASDLLFAGSADPILAILLERIEQEQQLETPEQIVDEMIARYLENPEDMPSDADYKEAIITYVSLVKKRHSRRQQQSSKLRSLLRKHAQTHSQTEPLALETFYTNAPATDTPNSKLGSSKPAPKLAASGA
ncbi:MAG: hypothetical protein AAGC93_07970 [Cyanobacteria bacterium P01_F01_bin.53]